MVRPVHVCCGVVFRQPQSTVLMAYQPGGSGAPVFSPTVSPGCVTEPARAWTAVQSDRAPAAANFVNLLFICNPPLTSPTGLGTFPQNLSELEPMQCSMVTQLRQLPLAPAPRWTFFGTVAEMRSHRAPPARH